MEYKSTAIVLSRAVVNDADVLVSLYSREKGKLNAVYKRGKKKPQVMASLELFNEDSFVLSERKTWPVIYSIDIKTIFYNIRGNYDAFLTASYFAKIIDRLTLEDNPSVALYELLRASLLMLDNGQNHDNVREYFHVNTLKIEGLWPEHKTTVSAEEFELILNEYTNTKNGGLIDTGKNKIPRSVKK